MARRETAVTLLSLLIWVFVSKLFYETKAELTPQITPSPTTMAVPPAIFARIIAYSLVTVPVVILILGAVIYYYKPIHIRATGIILVVFGCIELSVFPLSLYISGSIGHSFGYFIFAGLVAVETATIALGIASLIKRKDIKR